MYATNLTDAQWQVMKDLLPGSNRKRKYPLRSIVNALFYLVKTGCQWRMLPSDFPKWQIVYYYFKKWSELEIIDEINQAVIEKKRLFSGRSKYTSTVIIDCQSVKTTMLGGIRGYDGNKKINGRKRHLAVDTQGNIIECLVHSAKQHESKTAELLLRKLKEEQFALKKIIADGGYRGELIEIAHRKYQLQLEVIKRNEENKRFSVQPIRWIVERTIAWFNGYRRLSKDFERFLETSRAMIFLFSIRLSLNKF
jgi:transposase